jgi:hypothetical protein
MLVGMLRSIMVSSDVSEHPPSETASHPKRIDTSRVMKIGTPLGEVVFICWFSLWSLRCKHTYNFFLYKISCVCVGLVSEISQDLSLLGCDTLLDSPMKTSVTFFPLTQHYTLKDLILWQHCCESPQSHKLLVL